MPPRRVKIKGLPASRPSVLSPLPRSASLTSTSAPVVSAFLGALGRYRRLLLVLLLLALSNIAGESRLICCRPQSPPPSLATPLSPHLPHSLPPSVPTSLTRYRPQSPPPSLATARYRRLLPVLLLLALSNVAGYYYPVLWSPARRATLLATRATVLSQWWGNVSHPSHPSLGKEEGYEDVAAEEEDEKSTYMCSPYPRTPLPTPHPHPLSHSLPRLLVPIPFPLPCPPSGAKAATPSPAFSPLPHAWRGGGWSPCMQGRRLATLHGGEHHKVYDQLLCLCATPLISLFPSLLLPAPLSPPGSNSQPISRLVHLSRPALRSLVFLARHGLGNSLHGFVSAFVFARLSGRHLVTLHAGEHHKVSQPISRLAHLSRPSLRSLVFLARHGLGNSLRGFVSAFVFARLAGRRLVTLHAGEHHKPKYLMESIKSIPAMRNALASTHPIFGARTGSHFDLFWHRNDTLRSCVYAAFRCSSLWCVHSRAMFALIGQRGPSKKLLTTISAILHQSTPPGQPISSNPSSSSTVVAAATRQ
ncbi:unnamed protein product [Closterium sp. Naga37s-1]|nr:unnamed protein product [Closterium sp. Naga37s-1]